MIYRNKIICTEAREQPNLEYFIYDTNRKAEEIRNAIASSLLEY